MALRISTSLDMRDKGFGVLRRGSVHVSAREEVLVLLGLSTREGDRVAYASSRRTVASPPRRAVRCWTCNGKQRGTWGESEVTVRAGKNYREK